jgi:hypothetical protein
MGVASDIFEHSSHARLLLRTRILATIMYPLSITLNSQRKTGDIKRVSEIFEREHVLSYVPF